MLRPVGNTGTGALGERETDTQDGDGTPVAVEEEKWEEARMEQVEPSSTDYGGALVVVERREGRAVPAESLPLG